MRAVSTAAGPSWRGAEITVPSGAKARFAANLRALDVVRELERTGRSVTGEDQEVLARWSGWGAIAGVFEGRAEWAAEAEQLKAALTGEEYAAARANTLNAHYTDPEIARAMWGAVESTGMTGEARFLEPGCGTGTFMGQAPEGVSFLGVEVDPVTARIAHYLHPDAQVRLEGFEQTVVRPGMVDGAIGNVPFGSFSLNDPVHNPSRLPIHSHFLVKSLAATRPGGLVAAVTSAWTMDTGSVAARAELAKFGDLVAAVRLPGRAFTRVAGTEVTTDVLVFQRRAEERAVVDLSTLGWGRLEPVDEDGAVKMNELFVRRPELVLGDAVVRTGRFGPQLEVEGAAGGELAAQVRASLTAQLAEKGVRWVERPAPLALGPADEMAGLFERLPEVEQPLVGSLTMRGAVPGLGREFGEFVRWTGTQWEAATVPRSAVAETKGLLAVRDAMRGALVVQASTVASDADREQARQKLNAAYDRYVGAWGPINRYTVTVPTPSAGRVEKAVEALESAWRKGLPEWMDADDRADAVPSDELRQEWVDEALEELASPRKSQRHLVALAGDPALGSMLGLEVFDEETQSARKALIFSQDIVSASVGERSAESIDDAVAISMDELQRVDVQRVAELLDVDVVAAEGRLRGAAFRDPEAGEYVPAALYLSGRVRDKLAAAEAALPREPEMEGNIAALQGVVPEWIGIEQIDLVPGVNVLDADDYARFVRETFGVECALAKDPSGGSWRIASPSARAFSEEVQFRFGTQSRKPTELLESLMNQKPVVVRYRDADTKKMVVDRAESAAARTKGEAISGRFSDWVLENPELRERVEREWNHRFNQYVEPDFSKLGERLALPGLSEAFVPHPHQREAVARVLHSPATLLNHVVGAGKTGTMVMAAMEMRRTGQVRKPWMVVPNHLVEQATREAGQWYPGARILSIPTGLGPVERQMWISRSAAQDWDLVVCPQSVFKLVGVDPARAHQWIQGQIAELEDSKAGLDSGSRVQIKALEAQIKTLTARAERLLNSKDPGMTFEQTGCDYLLIDEAHHYKNLQRSSDITDLNCTGSQIASDLDMKIQVLREFRTDLAKREGTWTPGMVPHVVDFATGTPVANNLAEMWVMQRYLRPDLMQAQGTASLREWARAFARSAPALEMKADGATWVVKDRVRAFANVPELVATNRAFMSTVAKADLSFALPQLEGGERQVHVRPASDEVKAYIEVLRERAENPPADPHEDNILKVLNDGRLVAIDPQLRGLPADEDGGRVGLLADTIYSTWERTNGVQYRAADGELEPNTGGLQIVFCDQGIPGGDGFDLYGFLREQLVARGIDASSVAFIHDAADDAARGELFERCRDGRVSVLVGSTTRMGTGVNVQKRAVALHHVDVPWRPADLEQREGRIIRQGNQNAAVEIHTYVTQGTLDTLMWQTIERKAGFIGQLMQGRVAGRTFEQDGDDLRRLAGALSAVAADNPLVMERAEVVDRVMQLEAAATAHRTSIGSIRARLFAARGQLPIEQRAAEEKTALREHVGGVLYRSPAGDVFEKQGEATAALRGILLSQRTAIIAGEKDGMSVGSAMGIEFVVRGRGDAWRIEAAEAPSVGISFEASMDTFTSMQFVQRLENRLGVLGDDVQQHTGRMEELTANLVEMEAVLAEQGDFAQADELAAATIRLTEIDAQLGMADADGELEQPMVYAEHLQRLGERGAVPVKARDLRGGDVFRWGTSRDHYVVHERDESDGSVLAAVEGATDGNRHRVRGYESIEFIARQRVALTAWEKTVIDAGPRDRLCAARDLPDDARVTCEGAGGTLREGRVQRSGAACEVVFDDGIRSGFPVPERQPCFVKEYWTAEEVEAKEQMLAFPAWNEVVPGAVILRAWDELGAEIPSVRGIVRTEHASRLLDMEGRVVGDYPARAEVLMPEAITGVELPIVGIDGPIEVTELRAGDRVPIAQIDRDARSDRMATVLKPCGLYPSRSAETVVLTDTGERHVGRIKPDARVDVEARSIYALDIVEHLVLARARGIDLPGVEALETSKMGEHVGKAVMTRNHAGLQVGALTARQVPGGRTFYYSGSPSAGGTMLEGRERAVVLDPALCDEARVRAALSPTGGLAEQVVGAQLAALPARQKGSLWQPGAPTEHLHPGSSGPRM